MLLRSEGKKIGINLEAIPATVASPHLQYYRFCCVGIYLYRNDGRYPPDGIKRQSESNTPKIGEYEVTLS